MLSKIIISSWTKAVLELIKPTCVLSQDRSKQNKRLHVTFCYLVNAFANVKQAEILDDLGRLGRKFIFYQWLSSWVTIRGSQLRQWLVQIVPNRKQRQEKNVCFQYSLECYWNRLQRRMDENVRIYIYKNGKRPCSGVRWLMTHL